MCTVESFNLAAIKLSDFSLNVIFATILFMFLYTMYGSHAPWCALRISCRVCLAESVELCANCTAEHLAALIAYSTVFHTVFIHCYQFSSVQLSQTFVDGTVNIANTGRGVSSVHAWRRVTSCPVIAAILADCSMLPVLVSQHSAVR